ncbi:MAG: hypothetical protein ACJATA_000485 [Sphingobacteriales bacterium]|jgi:hypothetical protein
MKKIILILIGAFLISFVSNTSFAQNDTSNTETYIIVTNDGGEFIGKIISQDAKDVLIETKDRGQISIPKFQIKLMRIVEDKELDSQGNIKFDETFATRYFITTNGLPIEKGESYIQWNLYGPDFQFGVAKNFGVGIMTSWFGTPIIGSAKYTYNIAENLNGAVGALVGTGSWALPGFRMALPFTALTFGNRQINANLSAGYGALVNEGDLEGRALFSVASMIRVSNKISVIFDSFITPGGRNNTSFVLIIPGIRYQTSSDKAFQFGFAGLFLDGEAIPLPIPMVQWYRRI